MENLNELRKSIDETIVDISEKHRMHRKVQFLLDIRGLLIINKLKASYAEFGVFRGEMMYAAKEILKDNIDKYFGFDTFEGLPAPEGDDAKTFVFEDVGFMKCPYDEVKELLGDTPNELIVGDFREEEILSKIDKAIDTISILSLDCNWPSSVEASLDLGASKLVSGSIVYFDDYFVGMRGGDYTAPLIKQVEEKYGIKFIFFKSYAPCARAFVIEKLS